MAKKDEIVSPSGDVVAEMGSEPNGTLNLRQKLAYVRQQIRNIEKGGRNQQQSYDYTKAEDVAGQIGDMLADLNVTMTRENLTVAREIIEIERNDHSIRKDILTIIQLDYIFVDGDSDERLRCSSAGEGRDSGDKSLNKAFTAALKYCLTQVTVMRTGDDPEKVSDHDKDESQGNRERRTSPAQSSLPLTKDHQDRLSVIRDYVSKYPDEEPLILKKCGKKSIDEITEGQAIHVCEIIVKKLGIKPEIPKEEPDIKW